MTVSKSLSLVHNNWSVKRCRGQRNTKEGKQQELGVFEAACDRRRDGKQIKGEISVKFLSIQYEGCLCLLDNVSFSQSVYLSDGVGWRCRTGDTDLDRLVLGCCYVFLHSSSSSCRNYLSDDATCSQRTRRGTTVRRCWKGLTRQDMIIVE